MSPPHIQSFFGAKGGQGTTVTAAAVALMHAAEGRQTLLIDAAEAHDAHAVLGVPEPGNPTEAAAVMPGLHLRRMRPGTELHDTAGYDVVIIDVGTHRTDWGTATLVTRSCYLALRRALAATAPDNLVLIQETGRALGADDVASVLGVPILAVIPHDLAIARAVDAGLLPARLPDALVRCRRAFTVLPQSLR